MEKSKIFSETHEARVWALLASDGCAGVKVVVKVTSKAGVTAKLK